MLEDRDYMRRPDPGFHLPPWLANWNALHTIILLNVVVFLAQFLFGVASDEVQNLGSGEVVTHGRGGVSIAALLAGRIWTPFTYMFVHGGFMHLFVNLLLIGWAGSKINALLGSKQFLLIYFVSGLVGAAFQLTVSGLQHDYQTPIVGASACAFGLLFALASMLPHERVTLLIYFIIPVNMRLWTMAVSMLILELVLGTTALLSQSADEMWGNIAYFAHVGGALAGWYLIRLLGYGGNPMTYERLWRQQAVSPGAQPKRQRVSNVARRLKAARPEMDTEAPRPQPTSAKARPILSMIQEVDAVLDKIHIHGMSSLNDEERRLLDMASREIALRDQKRRDDMKL